MKWFQVFLAVVISIALIYTLVFFSSFETRVEEQKISGRTILNYYQENCFGYRIHFQ